MTAEHEEVFKSFVSAVKKSESDRWFAHTIGLFQGYICISDETWIAMYSDPDLIFEGTMTKQLKLIESPYPDYRKLIPKGLNHAEPVDAIRLYGLLKSVNPKVSQGLYLSFQEGSEKGLWPVMSYNGSIGRKSFNLKFMLQAFEAFHISMLIEGEAMYLPRQNMLMCRDKPLTGSKVVLIKGASA